MLRRVLAESLLLRSLSSKSLCLLFRLRTCGEIGFTNENYLLGKQMNCNTGNKELCTCYFHLAVWVGWELLRINHLSQCWAFLCPLPRPQVLLSLYKRNNLKWRNTSMSPFPPLFYEWLYNWFFFFPPMVPATGTVITIYLGSLFHYSRAAVKPEEKCCVLWFMEAIWPVFIREIYRMWCRLRKYTMSFAL